MKCNDKIDTYEPITQFMNSNIPNPNEVIHGLLLDPIFLPPSQWSSIF